MMYRLNARRGSSAPRRRRLSLLLASTLACVVLLAACGGDASDTITDAADAETGTDAETGVAEADTASETTTDATDAAAVESDDASAEETDAAAEPGELEELFPDVLDVTATIDDDSSWTFAATLSSPYDTPERYADAWRVVGPDGEVYGIRELSHDHASEQPFTRSHSGIEIPDDVQTVTVEGRDQVSGWGGATVEVDLLR